jgi:hypothetical protein
LLSAQAATASACVRACVRACTRCLTCPLLHNANIGRRRSPPGSKGELGCWAGCGPGGQTWPLAGPLAGSVAGDPDRHRGWLICPSFVPAAGCRPGDETARVPDSMAWAAAPSTSTCPSMGRNAPSFGKAFSDRPWPWQRYPVRSSSLKTCWAPSARPVGRPLLTYAETARKALHTTGIGLDSWYELAQGRSRWRAAAPRHLTSPDKTKLSGSDSRSALPSPSFSALSPSAPPLPDPAAVVTPEASAPPPPSPPPPARGRLRSGEVLFVADVPVLAAGVPAADTKHRSDPVHDPCEARQWTQERGTSESRRRGAARARCRSAVR